MRHNIILWGLLLVSLGAHGLEATGRLAWGRQVTLSTPASGMVVAVPVTAGDRVKEGGVLVRLDQRAVTARLAAAGKHVERARQAFEEAGRELERTEELYDRTLLADHDLQVARIAHVTAAAELKGAEARHVERRLDLEYRVVRAPFAGTVVQRHIHPGMAVVNTHVAIPLVTLASLRPYTVEAGVPGEWAAAVMPGQQVTVVIGDARRGGTVASLLPELCREGVSGSGYVLRVILEDDESAEFSPGQTVRILGP
ncbi:MAG: efflux RND transporter periplasmic adaptor subunit [Gammaproteobacteria bacterium]|nr:efflux RND transporter periplasmic adaptor subunit [Gammaproteobacteria bacterium]